MQKNGKVDIRKKDVCSKSVIKTFYGSKFLVSEYIFKLVYPCKGSRFFHRKTPELEPFFNKVAELRAFNFI